MNFGDSYAMTVNLDIDLLRTFVAIADSGSFTRAADTVHRTQSAVSMQVKRLEEVVGKPVFHRDGRRVRLTAGGEALLGYARRILRLHEEAAATLSQPELVGTVRVGTPDDYVMRFLPSILARFAQAYPRVQVAVHCAPSHQLSARLANGELDLTLVTRNPGEEMGEILRREPTVWGTSERHLAHEEEPLPLALFQEGCFVREAALRALDDAGRNYRVAYSSPSITGIHAAVSAGLAVTALARSILPPGVRALAVEEGFPPLPVGTIALLRAPGARSKAIDCLAAHFAEGLRSDEVEAA
jgi:DNA-binding transcriptional LysR family regulator